jgi:hypothetical protein
MTAALDCRSFAVTGPAPYLELDMFPFLSGMQQNNGFIICHRFARMYLLPMTGEGLQYVTQHGVQFGGGLVGDIERIC